MQSARTETRELVEELTVGFDALQDEYRELHGRYSGLGRKLQTAREQVSQSQTDVAYMRQRDRRCDAVVMRKSALDLSRSPIKLLG